MMLGLFQKQSGDTLDYDIDYSQWLYAGDYLVSVAVTVGPLPTDLADISQNVTQSIAKVWVGGGTSGNTYLITVTVTTSAGRVKQDEFKIKVKDN